MLIFEQLVGRGFMVLDPVRKVLVFNREVVGKFPAIRKAKMEEFKWLVGDWSAMNKVRATPTTPAYTDTYFYSYQLCEADTRISITGPGGMARPYLTFDPFGERWMMTFMESVYGVLHSKGWQRDSIVFTGCLTMLGVDCEIRQTISKRSADEFYTLNEEKIKEGPWVVTDEFQFRRK
jgi:hypothetical protein